MRKLFITALAALVSLAAVAAPKTYDVGGKWGKSSSATGGAVYTTFANLSFYYSSGQVLLTPDVLTGIAPKVAADGTTKAKLSSLTVKFAFDGGMYTPAKINFKAYAQNVTETAFPKNGSADAAFPYTTDCTATASIDEKASNYAMMYAGDAEVTLNFGPEGFVYEGGSILLTVFADVTADESIPFGGIYTFVTGATGNHSGGAASDRNMPAVSGQFNKTSKALPEMLLTYEEVVEAAPVPEPVEGKPVSGAAVGTKSSSGASIGMFTPVNPDYSYSTVQALYTAPQLAKFYTTDATGTTKAKITSIKSYVDFNAVMLSGSLTADVWVMNTDAETFPVNAGKEQWISDYQGGVHGQAVIDENGDWKALYEYSDGTVPVTITLDTPIEYEGKSLLVTWRSESALEDGLGGGSFLAGHYIFNPADGKKHYGVVSSSTKDKTDPAGNLANSSGWLPYMELDYVPVTYPAAASSTPVLFTSVTPALRATPDGKSNMICLDYVLDLPAECTGYTIKLGSVEVGTGTAATGSICYVPNASANLLVSVVPQGDGFIGGNFEVPAADIKALFAKPVVTGANQTGLFGAYEPQRERVATQIDLLAGAQVKMTTTVPVAKVSFYNNGGDIVYAGSSVEYSFNNNADKMDCSAMFAPMIPETAVDRNAATDFSLSGGIFAISKKNAGNMPVAHRLPVYNGSTVSWVISPEAQYPLAYSATPTLGAAPASVSKTDIAVKADSYTIRIAVTEQTTTVERYYARNSKLMFDNDDPTHLVILAGEGQRLIYAIYDLKSVSPTLASIATTIPPVTDPSRYPSDIQWVESTEPIVALDKADLGHTIVYARTVASNGTPLEEDSRYVSTDGSVSGIESAIAADSSAAEYFTLQGVKVQGELTPGVYIRRQGISVAKVTVK